MRVATICYSDENQPPARTPLPDRDHVLRYVGRKHVDNRVVNGSGFMRRHGEDAPSVNWMEYFALPVSNQVAEISARKRITYERKGVLVRLNVSHTKQHITSLAEIAVQFLHDPLCADAEKGWLCDPSHAVIDGIPVLQTPEAEAIGDLLVNCVIEYFVPDRRT